MVRWIKFHSFDAPVVNEVAGCYAVLCKIKMSIGLNAYGWHTRGFG